MSFPITKDFVLKEGADNVVTHVWYAAGSPVVLTGCTARMQVRATKSSDSALLLTLTSAGGGLIIYPTLGRIRRTITAAQAIASVLTVSPAFYDLKVYFPGGEEERIRQGRLYLDTRTTLP